jgi:hypothetical protein
MCKYRNEWRYRSEHKTLPSARRVGNTSIRACSWTLAIWEGTQFWLYVLFPPESTGNIYFPCTHNAFNSVIFLPKILPISVLFIFMLFIFLPTFLCLFISRFLFFRTSLQMLSAPLSTFPSCWRIWSMLDRIPIQPFLTGAFGSGSDYLNRIPVRQRIFQHWNELLKNEISIP